MRPADVAGRAGSRPTADPGGEAVAESSAGDRPGPRGRQSPGIRLGAAPRPGPGRGLRGDPRAARALAAGLAPPAPRRGGLPRRRDRGRRRIRVRPGRAGRPGGAPRRARGPRRARTSLFQPGPGGSRLAPRPADVDRALPTPSASSPGRRDWALPELSISPTALVFQDGAVRRILQPWIDRDRERSEASGSAPAQGRPRAAARPAASDPVADYPGQLQAALSELVVLGLPRSDARVACTWRELAR